ncbi:hypothetical protein BK011_02355 [Tenericutes bacterium MZ-XQ]|nr:hypothetical protein BK011_02355 [Tenericutes bacterium MZ-XQ]
MENNSIGQDTIKLTISKIFTMTVSLVFAMLLSRLVSLVEYGTYSQLLIVVNLATTIFMLGLPYSINYFLALAKDEEQKRKFLSIYFTLSTVISIIIGVVLILVSPIIVLYFKNTLLENFIYFLAIFPWTQISRTSIENVLIVYKKTKLLLIYQTTHGIFLLLSIVLVYLFSPKFEHYILLFLIIHSIFSIFVYVIIFRLKARLYTKISFVNVKNILYYSLPIGLATIVGTISIQLDKLIIGRYFSTEQLAIYTNASRELPVTFIATAFTAIVMPIIVKKISSQRTHEAIFLWKDSITISFIFICYLSIGIFVFAPDVVSILYSSKYSLGVNVFRIYTLVLLLRFTYFGMILSAMGKTKLILYSSVGSLILNVILNFLFLSIFGFVGPALATLCSILIMNFFQLLITCKKISVKLSYVFPWKGMLSILSVNILLGTLFYTIKNLFTIENYLGETFESISLALVWGVIYLLLFKSKLISTWRDINNYKIV